MTEPTSETVTEVVTELGPPIIDADGALRPPSQPLMLPVQPVTVPEPSPPTDGQSNA